eukprot:m.36405 g.36405  ORF g.36405 m.36405 type:complete len:243 (-) comp11415_c0_seq1:62-790(-)
MFDRAHWRHRQTPRKWPTQAAIIMGWMSLPLLVLAAATPHWSSQSNGTITVLGTGNLMFGLQYACSSAAHVDHCADYSAQIVTGLNPKSMCDMYSSYNLCAKTKGVLACVILALLSLAVLMLTYDRDAALVGLMGLASLFTMIAISLWISLQMAINEDVANGSSKLELQRSAGLTLFVWLTTLAGTILAYWGVSQEKLVAPPVYLHATGKGAATTAAAMAVTTTAAIPPPHNSVSPLVFSEA